MAIAAPARVGVEKECPSCGSSFFDVSQNQSRRFCELCAPRRGAPRPAPATRVRPRRGVAGEPFTLTHFRSWCGTLRLPGDERFVLEGWQDRFVADLFGGMADGWLKEAWLVVPEGNGKSTLVAVLVLYCVEFSVDAAIPIAASARDQAEIVFTQARGFVRRSPGLTGRVECKPGRREIVCDESRMAKVFASDSGTADGIIPRPIEILDELHRHKSLDLYRTWAGKLDKEGAVLVVISTAGEPGGEFEEVRAGMRRDALEADTSTPCFGRFRGHASLLHEYAVPETADPLDFEVVKQANPSSRITVEGLEAKARRPSFSLEHWKRLVCNIPTLVDGAAITASEWDALAEPGVEAARGAWCVGWMDLGWKIDTAAVGVLAWEADDRRLVPAPRVFAPPVREEDVVAAILDLEAEYGPVGWVIDPNAGGRQMAQQLEDGVHHVQTARGAGPLTFIEHSQDPAPMGLAAARLDEAIRGGRLVHDGDPVLRQHVLNAVKRPLGGERWRYDRPADAKGARRGKYPIDALTGLTMGHSVAVAEHDAAVFATPLVAWR